VMGMLEEMVGDKRLSVHASHESETDDIGCIATRKGDTIDLVIYRHLSVRDDGEPVDVDVAMEGKSRKGKRWRITGGAIIDRDHAGFTREHKADMEKALADMGDKPDRFAAAIAVSMANREKYLKMSELSELTTLPRLSVEDSGEARFALRLEGHSVVRLRLEQ
jgi:hypothetical protein